MVKLVLLAVAVWLIITIVKRYRNSLDHPRDTSPETMVQCTKCGVHLPKSDSLLIRNQYFCCEAHSKELE